MQVALEDWIGLFVAMKKSLGLSGADLNALVRGLATAVDSRKQNAAARRLQAVARGCVRGAHLPLATITWYGCDAPCLRGPEDWVAHGRRATRRRQGHTPRHPHSPHTTRLAPLRSPPVCPTLGDSER